MPKNKQPNPSSLVRRHRPFYKHPLFFIFVLVACAAGTLLAIHHLTQKPAENLSTSQSSQTSAEPASPSAKTTSEPVAPKETPNTPSDSSSASPDGKTPTRYDGADPNLDTSLTGSITTARFDGDKLVIRVTIDQYLSSGTCTLTLTSGDKTLEKTAPIAPIASTSSCEGFDITDSELSNFSRPININLSLTSGDKTGTITGVAE